MTSVAPLPHRRLIRVHGPDAATFLNGLFTLNTESVAADPSRTHYGAFLRPQGKLFADLIVHAETPETLSLNVHSGVAAEVLGKLKMFRLRARVEIEADDSPVFVAFGGDMPEGFIPDARSGVIDAPFGFASGQQTTNATTDDWADWRLAQGLSDPGEDFAPDALYAIEANLDLLGAIDFKKGCYVGQELTSRMKRRGPVKNRLLPFVYNGPTPEPEAEVLNADMRAGRVTVARNGHGLALMRLDRSDGDLRLENGPLKLDLLAWMAAQVVTGETT